MKNKWIIVKSADDFPKKTAFMTVISKNGTVAAGLWQISKDGFKAFWASGDLKIFDNDIYAYQIVEVPTDLLRSMYQSMAWNQKGVFSKNTPVQRYLEEYDIKL